MNVTLHELMDGLTREDIESLLAETINNKLLRKDVLNITRDRGMTPDNVDLDEDDFPAQVLINAYRYAKDEFGYAFEKFSKYPGILIPWYVNAVISDKEKFIHYEID